MRRGQFLFDGVYFALTLALLATAFKPDWFNADVFVDQFSLFAWLFLAAGLFGAFASLVAPRLGVVTLGRYLFNRPSEGRFGLTFAHAGAVAVLLLYVGVVATRASLFDLFDADGLAGAWRLTLGLTQPDFGVLPRAIAEMTETILIAFLATALAVPLAFVASFFAAKNLGASRARRIAYRVLRMVLNLTRSIEPLIWALIFTVWVGVGPFAGMLALMVHSLASLTKYYSEIIESVNEGPVEALRAVGAGPAQVALYAIVPQVTLPFVAMTIYRWDTNVRMATVIGLVGGGGIGTLLLRYQGQAQWPEVGTVLLVIAVVVWGMDAASAQIRDALK